MSHRVSPRINPHHKAKGKNYFGKNEVRKGVARARSIAEQRETRRIRLTRGRV